MDEQIKIWHRTKEASPLITDGLSGLAAGALSRAALYNALARQLQGPGRSVFLSLQEEAQNCVGYLRGVYRMVTGKKMELTAIPPAAEKLEPALRKCYGQALKALAAFEEKSLHPEYGPVFSQLAAKMRSECCKLAELMGL